MSQASFGDALDDNFDEGFADLPAIEVEHVATPSAERAPVRDSVRESSPEDPRAKAQHEARLVADLADYGDLPKGIVACVRYAARVGSRVLKLRKERAIVQRTVQQHSAAHHAALVALGHGVMALASDKRIEALRSQVALVLDERSKAERAGESAQQTRGDNQREIDELQDKITEQQHRFSPFLDAEKAAQVAQHKADEELRRAQAMQKRIEIELRALGEAGTADEARCHALTAQLEQRRGGVAELTSALTRANETLGRARRELALEKGALDILAERRKQLENAGRARVTEAEGQRQAADGAHDMALRALAEAARAQSLSRLMPEAEELAVTREAELQRAGESLVRFDRALALYDRAAVLKGVGLVAAILVAAITLLVLR